MPSILEAARPELARLLLTRDLTSAARHALDMEPAADAVSMVVTFDKNGMALDVTYTKGRVPIAGWGQ